MSTRQPHRRLATILVFNQHHELLMQHRDDKAPVAPNKWCIPGGSLEGDESPEEGARRELWEESGLEFAHPITLVWQGLLPSESTPGRHSEWHVYSTTTVAQQEDVILGEGQAMIFLPLEKVHSLDLTESTRFMLKFWQEQQTQK
ncbi:NUDIX domain-containing protein [Tengunoibacter tsumagoiensis]|uniref:Nudix hydrolase domain-containing protein n=1 Tax=Tengunoibacter tsumagoiensis TaxID=2014871 RepID=A0A401ZWB1_9CHLR|nr:NUDIX domain-containing protein [Tengunoibacter tsumagoiensis]GCE11185.1 hypothetical protein KTT_10440 [Tengunoibacter tsumagoiensis]